MKIYILVVEKGLRGAWMLLRCLSIDVRYIIMMIFECVDYDWVIGSLELADIDIMCIHFHYFVISVEHIFKL